jgi:N-acetylglucosamine kinase-like BadF-type ATPase
MASSNLWPVVEDMPAYILGVDGGQTSTKMVIATQSGRVLWQAEVASAFSDLDEDFSDSLERRLRGILGQALSSEPWDKMVFEMAVLGMSGAEPGSPLIGAFQRAVEGGVRAGRYLVVHDAVTNLLGASAGQLGIVVIAGGGAVAYGLAEDGRSWTSGGWGYAVGDEGSGYNIGRAAINHVFRALDGRDPPTHLAGPVLRHFKVSGPVALKYAILGGGISFQDIAGLPPLVAQIAAGGDATAQRLLREAGQHLAEATVAVARVLEMRESPVKVYLTGGLRHETHYLVPSFQGAIRQELPQALFHQPAFEPVIGTLFLAFRELGWPIDRFLLSALSESWKTIQGDEP